MRGDPAHLLDPRAPDIVGLRPRRREAADRGVGVVGLHHQISGTGERRDERPIILPRQAVPMRQDRSEEHTSELQSLMRISYAVFCLKKKNQYIQAANKSNTNN